MAQEIIINTTTGTANNYATLATGQACAVYKKAREMPPGVKATEDALADVLRSIGSLLECLDTYDECLGSVATHTEIVAEACDLTADVVEHYRQDIGAT